MRVARGFHRLHIRRFHVSSPRSMPLVIISPAKSLNELPCPSVWPKTTPRFATESVEIAAHAKKLTKDSLKSLMSVSDAIATLNVQRFQEFHTAHTKPCALCFDGPAYKALDAKSWTNEDVTFASKHIRFLSGLYGLLTPSDAIAPHRLEMSTKLKTTRGDNLYQFWGEQLADAIAEDLNLLPPTERFVVNVASAEYWRAANSGVLEAKHEIRVIHCVFPGPAVHAKAARGGMCAHVVKERVVTEEGIKTFKGANGEWRFEKVEEGKNGTQFVFARDAGAAGVGKTTKAKTVTTTKAKPQATTNKESSGGDARRSKRFKTIL